MDLFLDSEVSFEKVASEVMLPEDPNQWPNEILQELYKQVGYASDFELHVVMDRVDAERGYGFGHVEVQNKTEMQGGTSPEMMQAAGVQQARIPLVIKDRKLQPFDLLVTADSKMLPLTEQRLRQAIFRPQQFDITGRSPGDMSMIGSLYPPYRQAGGMGGGGMTMGASMGKEGSAKASLLEALLPSITEGAHHSFFAHFEKDAGLREAYVQNGAATGHALTVLGNFIPTSREKLASALLDSIRPTVVQLRREEAGGYAVKSANAAFWYPKTQGLSRGEALRQFGDKIVLAADLSGSATIDAGEGVEEEVEDPNADQPSLISDTGIYKVQDSNGRHLTGLVLTNLVDLDGTALPLSLFSNGSQQALQGEIVGVPVGPATNLAEGHPRGHGLFYRPAPSGKIKATIPFELKATLSGEAQGGVSMMAETFDGRPVQVMVQPNLNDLTLEGDHLLVPDTYSWMPLADADEVELVSDPASMNKAASITRPLAMVDVRFDGATFSVQGPAVEKLAYDEKNFLSLPDTLFLFSALGTNTAYVQEKLGHAIAVSAPVSVRVGRYIKTADQHAYEAKVAAANYTSETPFSPIDLVKEAAVIPDPTAVDTVLSLGFLSPDNVGIFLSHLPELDSAQEKMCELLLAARLGLREIPPSSLERAIKSTEETLEALKVLSFSAGA